MSGLTLTGFVAPTTDAIQTAIEADEEATIDAGIDTSPEQPLGQVNGITASELADAWAAIAAAYGALDPNTAEGLQLDVCLSLRGSTRKAASSTVVMVYPTGSPTLTPAVLDKNGNVVTPGNVLAQIAGHPEFGNFTNTSLPVTVPADIAFNGIYFVAVTPGPTPCNAGTLTIISPPVTGLTAISNPRDGAMGANIESDAAFRLRSANELVPPNGATNDSMRATLLAVKGSGPGQQGVIQAFVFENDTNATDGNGLPPHAIMAVVWDGSVPQALNNDIAQAIWNSKASGIQSFDGGSGTFGTAIDSAGTPRTIPFARATQLSMSINITVAVDSTFDPVNGPVAVAALLATYGNLLVQGQKVVVSEFIAQALTIRGTRDWTVFQIDSHASPTNTANIPVGITQIARFDTTRIAVSTTPFT